MYKLDGRTYYYTIAEEKTRFYVRYLHPSTGEECRIETTYDDPGEAGREFRKDHIPALALTNQEFHEFKDAIATEKRRIEQWNKNARKDTTNGQ